ncbi:hypothetical protein AB9E26_37255, partial [Rhizobium leguminosarum]
SPFGGDDFGGDFGGSASSAAGMDFVSSPSFEASPAPLGIALNSNFDLIMDIPIKVHHGLTSPSHTGIRLFSYSKLQ